MAEISSLDKLLGLVGGVAVIIMIVGIALLFIRRLVGAVLITVSAVFLILLLLTLQFKKARVLHKKEG